MALRVRKHPGVRGRRPDHKQQRRDVALLNASKRKDGDARIAKLYLPKGGAT